MKKKLLCGLLCLSFCLPAAKAAERPFSDVMETDWFAPYVAVCAQANILNGTGEGRFSPHRALTYQECTVLSLRLYDLLRGGDGLFDAPPADWGQMTLSTEAFTLTDHIRNFRTFPQWWEEDMPPWNAPALWLDDKTQALRLDGTAAAVTYAAREYPGRLRSVSDAEWSSARLVFVPEDRDAFRYVSDCWQFLPGDWEDSWIQTAWHYGDTHGLQSTPLFFRSGGNDRSSFAQALAYAAGALEKRNTVPVIPDVERKEDNAGVYALYEAGILSGIDSRGNFEPFRTLTRAEAAAMTARVLDPELRLSSSPAPTAELPYTLTEIPLPQGWTPTEDSNNVAAGWAVIQRRENEGVVEEAICRSDGKLLDLDGYFVYGFEHLTSRGNARRLWVMTREGATRWDRPLGDLLWNIYDVDREGLLLDQGIPDDSPAREEAQKTYFPTVPTWPQPKLDESAGLYGYVDQDGNWVIPAQYDMVSPFTDGAAVVHFRDMDWSATAIDETGTEILSRRYSELWYLGDGVFTYWGTQNWRDDCGTVTMEGVETPTAAFSGYFNGGLAAHHGLVAMYHESGRNSVMAYYDLAGNPVTEDFDWAGPIGEDGTGFVCLNEKLYRIQFQED